MPDEPTSFASADPGAALPPGQIEDDLHEAGTEVRAVAEDARDEMLKQASQLKEAATQQLGIAKDRARTFATERKADAADRLDEVSQAVSRVADELVRTDGVDAVAGYVRDVAGGIRRVSDTVRSSSVDELVGIAEDFGRRQPLAFLGAAALAGFAASRFMMASAERRASSFQAPNDTAISQSSDSATPYEAGAAK